MKSLHILVIGIGLLTVSTPQAAAANPADHKGVRLSTVVTRESGVPSTNISIKTLRPLRVEGGNCKTSKTYSHSLVFTGRFKDGPETNYLKNETARRSKFTVTNKTSGTWSVNISTSLEIDVSAWVAGVKSNIGVAVQRDSTVEKGVQAEVTVPSGGVVGANYGWVSAKVRTTLRKKQTDCSTREVVADVTAPIAKGWRLWDA